jgi:hypothetical protein
VGKNNPVIGSVECPNCGADTPVKENKNGNGYFFCDCGVHMRFNKSLTHSMFIMPSKMSELGEENLGKTENQASDSGEQNNLPEPTYGKGENRKSTGSISFFD